MRFLSILARIGTVGFILVLLRETMTHPMWISCFIWFYNVMILMIRYIHIGLG